VRAGMKPVHHCKGKSGAAGCIPAAKPALPVHRRRVHNRPGAIKSSPRYPK